MTLLTVVRDVCAAVGVAQPATVFGALTSNRTMTEMLAVANEMAARIAGDTREWAKLKRTATYVGDGILTQVDPLPAAKVFVGTEAFDFPADYKRMLLTSNLWRSSSTQVPMDFIADTDEWVRRRMSRRTNSWGEWTIIGDKIHIFPVMGGEIPLNAASVLAWLNNTSYGVVGVFAKDVAAGTYWKVATPHTSSATGTFAEDRAAHPEFWTFVPYVPAITASHVYISKNCISLFGFSDGLVHMGDTFLADGDIFILGERLLKLGMVWHWKQLKGSPYAEDLGTYQDALAVALGSDKPAPILVSRPTMYGLPVYANYQ